MTDRHSARKILKILTISIILLCLVFYITYEIQKIIFGPKIEISFPKNGSLMTSSSTEILGIAKNIKEISLNDRIIFIDELGNFKEELLLSKGYNVFVIKASDKFDRKIEKIIEIINKN
ncbi:MAG: hypothetical protein V1910_02355 [bacterium]